MSRSSTATVLAGIAAVTAACAPGRAAAQDFYAGRQITLIIGSSPGGGYDVAARLIGRHLGRMIPGHPAVIPQNLPGAAGMASANMIYNTSARDGTVIGAPQRGVLLAKVLGNPGVQFDIDRLSWIGSLNTETGLVVVLSGAPHRTAKNLLETELVVGASSGSDPETSPRLYNGILGMKFKIVTGYPGSNEALLAMERGEVQGSGDWGVSSLKAMRPTWLQEGRIRILLQGALRKHPSLPDVPLATEFARSDVDRRALELYFTQKTVARPVVAPPAVPAERVAILRSAFKALGGDAAFLADAERTRQDIDIVSGEEVDKVVAAVSAAPADVAARLRAAMRQP